jgi:hypothetical protein
VPRYFRIKSDEVSGHMKNDPPTLENIAREVNANGYFDRAYRRARRRKSLWNIVFVPLVLAGILATSYTLFHIMWGLHTVIYPGHVGKLGEFWGRGTGLPSFVASFLLLIPLLILSLPVSMLLANSVLWLIPSARRALDQEAEGIKWASFDEAMGGLWRVCKIMVPICLLLSLIGAATLSALR